MNLQQLKHFIALVETGSFSRASEQVHLSQPALSRSIQALEGELGAPLIERAGKHSAPTELGRVIADRARKVLLEVEDLKREAELQAQGAQGIVHLGLGAAPGALLAGHLMDFLLTRHPAIRLKVSRGSPSTLLQLLRERQIDMLVAHERLIGPSRDLQLTELPKLRSAFLCRAGHPLLNTSGPVTLADVRRYPVVSTGLSPEVVKLLSPAGDPLHFESEDVNGLLGVAHQHDCVLLGVKAFNALAERKERLVEIPIPLTAPLMTRFVIVSLLGRTDSAPNRILREQIHERFAQLAKAHNASPHPTTSPS